MTGCACSNGSVIIDYKVSFEGTDITADLLLPLVKTQITDAVNQSAFGNYEVELKSLYFQGKISQLFFEFAAESSIIIWMLLKSQPSSSCTVYAVIFG